MKFGVSDIAPDTLIQSQVIWLPDAGYDSLLNQSGQKGNRTARYLSALTVEARVDNFHLQNIQGHQTATVKTYRLVILKCVLKLNIIHANQIGAVNVNRIDAWWCEEICVLNIYLQLILCFDDRVRIIGF